TPPHRTYLPHGSCPVLPVALYDGIDLVRRRHVPRRRQLLAVPGTRGPVELLQVGPVSHRHVPAAHRVSSPLGIHPETIRLGGTGYWTCPCGRPTTGTSMRR